jgi:hypothetical protein
VIAWRSPRLDGFVVLVFVGALLLATRILSGCLPESVTPSRAQAAEASYTAEHMACVDTFGTREQIDACREGVRVRWGRFKDGGAR